MARLVAPERGGLFVDCTLGMGGHAEALLDASPAVRLVGIDRDAESLALASERLSRFGERFRAAHADYRRIREVLDEHAPGEPAAGVLADFGISSHQLEEAERGFSFQREAPLDMRMDRSRGRTACRRTRRGRGCRPAPAAACSAAARSACRPTRACTARAATT